MPDNADCGSVPQSTDPAVAPETGPLSGQPRSDRAICAGEDPGIFFPAHDDPATKARRICGSCPVHADCLQYATRADEWGIWGGLDREQRRALRDAVKEPVLLPTLAVAREENRESA